MFRNISAVTFKICEYCNLDCEYCFQKYDVKTRDRKFTMYDELVSFLSKLPLDEDLEFKVTGGEASLFCDDIRYAYQKLSKLERLQDIRINFTTISNGTNMEGLIELMDDGILRSWGCKYSWDGLYSASNSRKPKNPKYTDEFFNDKVRLIGSSRYNKDILVRMALSANTIDSLADSFEFALKCGCRKLEYYYLSECEDYLSKEFQDKFDAQLSRIVLLCQKYPDFTLSNFDTLFMNKSLKEGERLRAITCRHLGRSLYIDMDGKVAPCGFFSKDAIYENQTLYIADIKEGFYKDRVESFINQYKQVPMCYNSGCNNLQCFECPAATLFKKGSMANKLYQSCTLRDIEKRIFDIYNEEYPYADTHTNRYWEKRYSYMKDFSVDYSIPQLPYKKEEI